MAVKDLGLSIAEFGWMTPFEFYYRRKHAEEQEAISMHKIRTIIAEMYNSSGFTKKRLTPQDVFQIPQIDRGVQEFRIPTIEEEADAIKQLLSKPNGRN